MRLRVCKAAGQHRMQALPWLRCHGFPLTDTLQEPPLLGFALRQATRLRINIIHCGLQELVRFNGLIEVIHTSLGAMQKALKVCGAGLGSCTCAKDTKLPLYHTIGLSLPLSLTQCLSPRVPTVLSHHIVLMMHDYQDRDRQHLPSSKACGRAVCFLASGRNKGKLLLHGEKKCVPDFFTMRKHHLFFLICVLPGPSADER